MEELDEERSTACLCSRGNGFLPMVPMNPRGFVPDRTMRIHDIHNNFRPLTGIQILQNLYFLFYRSRIDQVNAIIRNHDDLEGRPFRGDFEHLTAHVKITVHATNVSIKLGNFRLEGIGRWAHAMPVDGP